MIQTRITYQKIPSQKSVEFGMALKQSATRYKQKQENFLLPDHQLAENVILAFGL